MWNDLTWALCGTIKFHSFHFRTRGCNVTRGIFFLLFTFCSVSNSFSLLTQGSMFQKVEEWNPCKFSVTELITEWNFTTRHTVLLQTFPCNDNIKSLMRKPFRTQPTASRQRPSNILQRFYTDSFFQQGFSSFRIPFPSHPHPMYSTTPLYTESYYAYELFMFIFFLCKSWIVSSGSNTLLFYSNLSLIIILIESSHISFLPIKLQ